MYLENMKNMYTGTTNDNYTIQKIDNLQSPNPCEYCPNNPKNNPLSSGYCHCTLPNLYNPLY